MGISITNTVLLIILLSSLSLSMHFVVAANTSSSNSRCRECEWRALMEFKGSLVNDASKLSSWAGRDCCSNWVGITCHNSTGHVQMLHLEYDGYPETDYNFSSPLSPWLFNLSRLESLMIPGSGLQGPIPNMFQKLPSLIHLDLSVNSFDSPFPDSLCSLTSLTELEITGSRLKGPLPPCLGNMTSLTGIRVGGNDLSGNIPSELGYLTNLIDLYLPYNHLNSSIPSTLGHLSELVSLDLSNNQLSGTIPLTLGNLTKLTQLYLFDNSLTGELSESFSEGLGSLTNLDMSRNKGIVLKFSSQWIPPFQIREMQMSPVFIGTKFPPWLQTQRNLEQLSLSNAGIFGATPSWCQTAFPNLSTIDLSNNLLTGPVPTFHATNSASIMVLRLSKNRMSGNIPEELCNLKYLRVLSLVNNQLTGRIPACLLNLQNLYVLDLANNSLSGHIPKALGSLYLMTFLNLGKNNFQGSTPEWIGEKFSSLQYLGLQYNNFSSEIPLSLCQLASLRVLDLGHNNLVGSIPPCLGNLSKMSSNESGFYNYVDPLSYISKGTEREHSSNNVIYTKFISLSSNHLHGEIPAQIMSLKGLQSLDLSNNELIGMIPEHINNLTQLESLDLSMNKLSGTIPQSLTGIDALAYLNLSFNNLEGRIPSSNHFDTLDDPSIYQGNMGLCGKLLKKGCPGDDSTTSNYQPNGPVPGDDDEFDQLSWLYAGIGPGFAVGFLGVIFVLYFKHSWRIAYFAFADNTYNKVRVTVTVMNLSLRRKFQ